MHRHVRSWLVRRRDHAGRMWPVRGYPTWADPVMALLFSIAAVWLALRGLPDAGAADGVPALDIAGAAADRPRPDAPTGQIMTHLGTQVVVLGSLLVTAPLAIRRRWPMAVFVAQFVGSLAIGSAGTWVTLVALLVGAYSLAMHGRSSLAAFGTLGAAATVVSLGGWRVDLPLPDWSAPFVILLSFGLFGLTVRAFRARATASSQRAQALHAGQEASLRAAVAEERARLARELHDVVSHHVSVMVIQAGAAGKVIEKRPDLARDALTAIADSGSQAMAELRDLLGVLTPGTQGEGPLRPQPGLDELDALVDKIRAAGQPVTLHASVVKVPRGVDTAAYRVVQEALTNALRYAPGATTTVVVEPDGTDLTVEITDEGAGDARPDRPGAGTGLLGLAERLRFYGGTLHTGRRLSGGFRVSARIPLDAAPPQRNAEVTQ